MNIYKTEALSLTPPDAEPATFYIGNAALKSVDNFTYLGSVLNRTGTITDDVQRRITLASAAFGRLSESVPEQELTDRHKSGSVQGCLLQCTEVKIPGKWQRTVEGILNAGIAAHIQPFNQNAQERHDRRHQFRENLEWHVCNTCGRVCGSRRGLVSQLRTHQ